ncbi:hypothetical protein O3M35_012107 [Rhynocoris fuscipes]|uniref:BOD1/SHG1 domain-containing protein n=1 Tax=Rhynocoris fuscipes TaxID=488301 RepID=A0AAW1CXM6_9HEMI
MDYMYQTVDKDFVETIVGKLKSQGIFDQFRKDCLADVDTKPAYQNLQERVNGTVNSFLEKHKWQDNLNKTQLRESLRRHVQQGFLETGVDRIVDQVVNPKIYTVFKPKVEDVVYDSLGIPKPKKLDTTDLNLLNFILKHPPPPHPPPPLPPPKNENENKTKEKSNDVSLDDLLPKDLDPVSPGSVDNASVGSKEEEEVPPPGTDDINDSSAFGMADASNDESKLSLSELSSQESTKHSSQTPIKSAHPVEAQGADINTNTSELKSPKVSSPFKNFSNLNEKIKQVEIKLIDADVTTLSDSKDEDVSNKQSDAEVVLEQNDDEKEKLFDDEEKQATPIMEDSLSLKLHSEDSRSSFSSFSREKKSHPDDIKESIKSEEDKLKDESESDKVFSEKFDDIDSSNLSTSENVEIKIDENEKKDGKADKKRTESSSSSTSSKHRSSRHSGHDLKHKRHDKNDDKSKSSRSDKDVKHRDDRHKSSRDSSSKRKDDHDHDKYKHGDKTSKHKDDRRKPRDSAEKSREDKGKSDKSDRTKHRHSEDKHETKSLSNTDALGLMEIEDQEELSNITTGSTGNFSDKDTDIKSEREITDKEDDEKQEKRRSKHYEKEEKSDKSKSKGEKSDKGRSKENDSKRHKERDDKHKSEKSSERAEKNTRGRENEEKSSDQRSSKSEKSKNKDDADDSYHKEDKVKKSDVKTKEKSSTEIESVSTSSTKKEKSKNDDKDSDKDKTRKHSYGTSEKSRSRHSSISKSKDKDDKKDKHNRKRKGERCEEIKVKESRRSSDRDHNGSGSSGPSSGGTSSHPKDSGHSSSNKTNHEPVQEQSGNEGSSTEENTDSPDVPNAVDILLMQINDSIENHETEEKSDPQPPQPVIKKPKIANNIFEIRKIMQARRNLQKVESQGSVEVNSENVRNNEESEDGLDEPDKVADPATSEEVLNTSEELLVENENENQSEDLSNQIKEQLVELESKSEELADSATDKEQEENEQITEQIGNSSIENESLELNKQLEEKLAEIQAEAEFESSLPNESTTMTETSQEILEEVIESKTEEVDEKEAEAVNKVMEDEPIVIKKRRIAKNIYEVRKIMHMKKRLERKKKLATQMKEHNKTDLISNDRQPSAEENKAIPNDLAGEHEINNAINDNQISSEVIEKQNETEECADDNAENEEPAPLKTPRIAKNIYEVRKIMRARRALKKKLNYQSKTNDLNIKRKNTRSLLNKKLIPVKRKNEQIIKLKLINKDRKNRLRRDNMNSRPLLGKIRSDSDVSDKMKTTFEEEVVNEVPSNVDDSIDCNVETVEENSSKILETNDSFFGFTKDDINVAVRQFEELHNYYIMSRNNDSKHWNNNNIDGNSNMLKPTLIKTRQRHTISSDNTLDNNLKLEADINHEQVIRDILNGKNGCSIKLTKSRLLDEQAKSHLMNTRAKTKNNKIENLEILNSKLEDSNILSSPKMTEDVLDNLMKDNNLIPDPDIIEYDESQSNSEENFKAISNNCEIKLTGEEDCNENVKHKVTNKKVGKIQTNTDKITTKRKVMNQKENNAGKKGNVNNSQETVSKTKSNTVVQEDKTKRAVRASTRSSQRYDSEDLYKPRLSLSSQNSARNRVTRNDSADNSTGQALPNLRRKIR